VERSAEIGIERIGTDRVDELLPPYEALLAHHAAIAPELVGAPARSAAEAWPRRRAHYLEWLREPGFGLLAADAAGAVVGYAAVTVEAGFDSWDSGPVGEVHDLAVLPEHRGAGLGAKLLAGVCAELRRLGVERYQLTVLGGNDDAVRFYERQGLTTVMTQMLGPTTPRD
jgi:GNAT superfamily N-acetyltransferase